MFLWWFILFISLPCWLPLILLDEVHSLFQEVTPFLHGDSGHSHWHVRLHSILSCLEVHTLSGIVHTHCICVDGGLLAPLLFYIAYLHSICIHAIYHTSLSDVVYILLYVLAHTLTPSVVSIMMILHHCLASSSSCSRCLPLSRGGLPLSLYQETHTFPQVVHTTWQ